MLSTVANRPVLQSQRAPQLVFEASVAIGGMITTASYGSSRYPWANGNVRSLDNGGKGSVVDLTRLRRTLSRETQINEFRNPAIECQQYIYLPNYHISVHVLDSILLLLLSSVIMHVRLRSTAYNSPDLSV